MLLHFNNTFIYFSAVLLRDAPNGLAAPLCFSTASSVGEEEMFSSDRLLYLLQVIELHGYLSEEEVDVRSPLDGTDKIRLYIVEEREKEGIVCKRGVVAKQGLMKYRWGKHAWDREKAYSGQCLHFANASVTPTTPR